MRHDESRLDAQTSQYRLILLPLAAALIFPLRPHGAMALRFARARLIRFASHFGEVSRYPYNDMLHPEE